jgi:hypothetical protein
MQNKVGALRAWTVALACALTALTGAQPALAAPAIVEGVLETIVEDHSDHGHTRHFLKTDKGRVELRCRAARGCAPAVRRSVACWNSTTAGRRACR